MKEIPQYEGFYAADEKGNIWSLPRKITCWNGYKMISYTRPLKKLIPHLTQCGYLSILLCTNNKKKNESVHRLMGYTFLNLSSYLDINHKDGNKQNNHLENLEVCTRKENLQHAAKKGLIRDLKGENHPTCKTPLEMRPYIEKDIRAGISCKKACKKYEIGRATFYSIKDKTHWWYRS